MMTFKKDSISLSDVSYLPTEYSELSISLLNNEHHKDNFAINIYSGTNYIHIVVNGDALVAAIAELLSDDNVN